MSLQEHRHHRTLASHFSLVSACMRIISLPDSWPRQPQNRQSWTRGNYEAHTIWVNCNISLSWIKAIWGWFLLLTMIPSEVAVRVVIIYPDTIPIFMYTVYLFKNVGFLCFSFHTVCLHEFWKLEKNEKKQWLDPCACSSSWMRWACAGVGSLRLWVSVPVAGN